MSLIGCNIGYFSIRFSIFAYLSVLILTPKSCQDLLFIVYICIGFLWSSRSQILKELDGLDLSSNPVQSSPIQSLVIISNGVIGTDVTDNQVLDCSSMTLLPGLIDAHVHMFSGNDESTRLLKHMAEYGVTTA